MSEAAQKEQSALTDSGEIADQSAAQNGQEIEVKFRTDALGLKRVMDAPVFGSATIMKSQSLRSVYFDTPDGDVRKNGCVLRLRKNGRALGSLCLKWTDQTSEGPFTRGEIEVPCREQMPNLSLFDAATQSRLDEILGGRPLEPQFETQIKRRIVLLQSGNSLIEVALDEGVIVAGAERLPVAEVELELKSGSETDLYDLAMKLVEETALSLDFVSKSEKGYRCANREAAGAVKAVALDLKSSATLDDAVAAVLSNTLAQFVANWAALRESDSPESVHQMRVALRRMRSGLAMFRKVLPSAEIDELRGEAKRIASALGAARECDVFQENAESGPLASLERTEGVTELLSAIEARRVEAYRNARSLIEASATSLFVLKVQGFLARRAWRGSLPSADLASLTAPARQFAKEALDRLRARALKRGRKLMKISDSDRHELRIALKNLRYCAEFFGTLFDRRRQQRDFLGGVAALQDLLGTHNDVVSTSKLLDQLPTAKDPAATRVSGYLLGWYARGIPIADRQLSQVWKKFKAMDLFWT